MPPQWQDLANNSPSITTVHDLQDKPTESAGRPESPFIDSSSGLISQFTSKPPLHCRSLFSRGIDHNNLRRATLKLEEQKQPIRAKLTSTTDRTQSRVLSIADISLRDEDETPDELSLDLRAPRERLMLLSFNPSNH